MLSNSSQLKSTHETLRPGHRMDNLLPLTGGRMSMGSGDVSDTCLQEGLGPQSLLVPDFHSWSCAFFALVRGNLLLSGC